MAKAAGLSVSAFERRFKVEIHQTPLQYITTRRMQLAGQMLLQGHLVYEVADALGYRDPLYFSKVFRKHIGMPPGSYVAYYNTRQDTKQGPQRRKPTQLAGRITWGHLEKFRVCLKIRCIQNSFAPYTFKRTRVG